MPETSAASWMDQLLAAMSGWQASDLFVTEGKVPAVRVQGSVRPVKKPATSAEALRGWIEQGFTKAQIERLDADGDLDAGYTLDDGRRFRVNLSRQRGGTSVVARAVPYAELDVEDLGLPPAVGSFADLTRGLVLVTGATGSGKSTTLTALVHRINRTRAAHVVTIEDPIEYLHRDVKARVTQREIGADTQSFSSGLRHVLRQSPDVVMLGEIRDGETASVAIQAALTGHLILATLHTNDAVQSIQRLIGLFPESQQAETALDLSLCLEGIVSQRLLPTADEKGRVLAFEVLTRTPAVVQLLKERRFDDIVDLMKGSTDPSIATFHRSLLRLYREGRSRTTSRARTRRTPTSSRSTPGGFARASTRSRRRRAFVRIATSTSGCCSDRRSSEEHPICTSPSADRRSCGSPERSTRSRWRRSAPRTCASSCTRS